MADLGRILVALQQELEVPRQLREDLRHVPPAVPRRHHEGVAHGDFSPRNSVEDVVDRLTAQIEGLRVHALLEPARLSRERMFALLKAQVEQDLRFSFPVGSGGQP